MPRKPKLFDAKAEAHSKSYKASVDELYDEKSDRSTIIVGAAICDEALASVIRDRLRDCAETEALFGPQGPLRDFSAKIDLAYSLGILGLRHRDDLHQIRKIRNECAHKALFPDSRHKLTRLTFQLQKIKDLCNTLWVPTINPSRTTPKAKFISAVVHITGRLWNEKYHKDDAPAFAESQYLEE